MSQASTSYTAEKLYEEAYNIQYNWDKILPSDVLEFHTLHILISVSYRRVEIGPAKIHELLGP